MSQVVQYDKKVRDRTLVGQDYRAVGVVSGIDTRANAPTVTMRPQGKTGLWARGGDEDQWNGGVDR